MIVIFFASITTFINFGFFAAGLSFVFFFNDYIRMGSVVGALIISCLASIFSLAIIFISIFEILRRDRWILRAGLINFHIFSIAGLIFFALGFYAIFTPNASIAGAFEYYHLHFAYAARFDLIILGVVAVFTGLIERIKARRRMRAGQLF